MQTWNSVDKSKWGDGPWIKEPDKAQWIRKGMDCLIVRNGAGGLCGYAGVPESHPWFGKGYDDRVLPKCGECDDEIDYTCYDHSIDGLIDIHGGLTFSDKCRENGKICHIGDDIANKIVWWFGFDCVHSGDISPAYSHTLRDAGLPDMNRSDDIYRDMAYVKEQTEHLADQLIEIK